jgi:hypothetical protein
MGQLDQRLAARFNVEVSAEVYTPGDVLAATTRNLSATGVCLELNTGLTEGSTVGVSLFFTADGIEDPDTDPLNVKASVVWCAERDGAGYSAGACFEDLSANDQKLLGEFLDALGS